MFTILNVCVESLLGKLVCIETYEHYKIDKGCCQIFICALKQGQEKLNNLLTDNLNFLRRLQSYLRHKQPHIPESQ